MGRLDTTIQAHQVQIDIFRKMSPEKRLENAVSLAQSARKLMAEGIRARHPEYSEQEVRLASIRLTLGEALFACAYPEALHIRP
jgi:hypothetical protein